MNEESDGSAPVTRVDVLGTYDLTDVNTTPSAAGKLDNAASFDRTNAERLTVDAGVGNEVITTGTDVGSLVYWFYFDTTALVNFDRVFEADNGTTADYGLVNFDQDIPRTVLVYRDTGGGSATINIAAAQGLLVDDWNMMALVMQGDKKLGWSINNSALAYSAALANPPELGRRLAVGCRWDGVAPGTCKVDNFYSFSATKDQAWINGMWAAGAGVEYPS